MPLRAPVGVGWLEKSGSDGPGRREASSSGVIAIARREAIVFGRRQARIVPISPGFIDTQMAHDISPEADLAVARFVASGAIPRLGRPEEVAAMAALICSPSARFITGCDIMVDGGQAIGMGLAGAAF